VPRTANPRTPIAWTRGMQSISSDGQASRLPIHASRSPSIARRWWRVGGCSSTRACRWRLSVGSRGRKAPMRRTWVPRVRPQRARGEWHDPPSIREWKHRPARVPCCPRVRRQHGLRRELRPSPRRRRCGQLGAGPVRHGATGSTLDSTGSKPDCASRAWKSWPLKNSVSWVASSTRSVRSRMIAEYVVLT
jgi:hypothetical protein